MSTTTTRRARDVVTAELAASGAMFPFTLAEFFAAVAAAGIPETTLDALIAGTMVAVPLEATKAMREAGWNQLALIAASLNETSASREKKDA